MERSYRAKRMETLLQTAGSRVILRSSRPISIYIHVFDFIQACQI